jgi:membrane-associated phospholipid phosphatase
MGVVCVGSLLAQAPDTARHGPVFARTDAAVVGVAALTSGVLLGWDGAIARHMQASPLRHDAFVRSVMEGASMYGDPGTIVLGAGVWLSGRLAHDATRERIGMRAVEAIVASGILGGALKGVAGRARPDTSGNPRDFVLGRGIGSRDAFQSFPSGHATAAWAFASAVDAEWQRLSPSRPRWVPAALYAAAALTAASRVYRNRHWASDVVMGGAIGFVSGRAVVRWHRDTP